MKDGSLPSPLMAQRGCGMVAGHLVCALVSWRKDPQIIAAWPLYPLPVLSAAGGSQRPSSTPHFQGDCWEFRRFGLVLPRSPLDVGSCIRDACLPCHRAGAPLPKAQTLFQPPREGVLESMSQHPQSPPVSSTDTVIASCSRTKHRELKNRRRKS